MLKVLQKRTNLEEYMDYALVLHHGRWVALDFLGRFDRGKLLQVPTYLCPCLQAFKNKVKN